MIYENLQIKNIEEPKESEEEKKYIEDGLILLYDGENNTGEGHSNDTTTWKNIAPGQENKNDGILMNIDYNEISRLDKQFTNIRWSK